MLNIYSTFLRALLVSSDSNALSRTEALGSNAVAGTFRISRLVFDRWAEFANLRDDLKECCVILSLRTGLSFDLSESKLSAAHTAWQQDMGLWLNNLLPAKTKELSHIKKASILLAKLYEFGVVTVSDTGIPLKRKKRPKSLQHQELIPSTPNPLSKKDVKKFNDGGCHYVAWLVAYHVCEFFEQRRSDRIDKYESRLTEEFEIDMVSGLLSAKLSAQGIHLILKALFLRD